MIPTASEERDLQAAGWKKMPPIAEGVFFVLTLLAVGALYWFLDLGGAPKGPVTLVVCLAAAELLIWRYRYWRTGIESALWIGGLCAFIFWLPNSGKPEGILTFVAAFALAGWRMRNPLFGFGAVWFTLHYLGLKGLDPFAAMAGLVTGIIATVAGILDWKRPSTAALFVVMALGAPVAGYLMYGDSRRAPLVGTAIAFLLAAAIDLAIGVRMRMRAPLMAGAVCIGIGCYELRELLRIADEWKFILAGAALLGIAITLMRVLRERKTGIVVTPSKEHELQELVQAAVTVPMATPEAAAPSHTVSGGGEFGGAGASGQF
jgi:hypothetical protein